MKLAFTTICRLTGAFKENGANGHSNALDVVEEFQGPGFRFVRVFLLVILLLVGILLALTGFLSWYRLFV